MASTWCFVCDRKILVDACIFMKVGLAQRKICLCRDCYQKFDTQTGICRQVGDYVFSFRWFGLDVEVFDPFGDLRPVQLRADPGLTKVDL